MWQIFNQNKNKHLRTHSMSFERLNRLKTILSLPSLYRNEKKVTNYVSEFCIQHGFEFIVDDLGSVLITKGRLGKGEFYPMVAAHMDTVHQPVPKEIREDGDILTAWNKGVQVGIGGDDLAGVAICLELLLLPSIPVLKVGLFVSEEIGCIGSRHAVTHHREWFNDIGYMIEFDGPEDYMVTHICSGVELFDPNGEFILKSFPLLKESMGEKMRFFNHPYTDVSVIKSAFNFSCINISAGYFKWHTNKEYVVISAVEKACVLGEKMIHELGHKLYKFEPTLNGYFNSYDKKKSLWD